MGVRGEWNGEKIHLSFLSHLQTAITASAVMVIDHYWKLIGKPFNGQGSGIPRNRKFVSPLRSTPYHPSIGHFGPQEFFSGFHWEPPVSFSRFHALFSRFHGQTLVFSHYSTPRVKNTKAMPARCFFSPFHSPFGRVFSHHSTPLPFQQVHRPVSHSPKCKFLQVFAVKRCQNFGN